MTCLAPLPSTHENGSECCPKIHGSTQKQAEITVKTMHVPLRKTTTKEKVPRRVWSSFHRVQMRNKIPFQKLSTYTGMVTGMQDYSLQIPYVHTLKKQYLGMALGGKKEKWVTLLANNLVLMLLHHLPVHGCSICPLPAELTWARKHLCFLGKGTIPAAGEPGGAWELLPSFSLMATEQLPMNSRH